MTIPEDHEPSETCGEQPWLLPLEIGTAWWNMMVDLSFGPAAAHRRHANPDRSPVFDPPEGDRDHALFA